MSTNNLFLEYLDKTAEIFLGIDKKKTVRLISHIDSDGISAAAIILNALIKLGYRYSITFVNQLDHTTIDQISKEDHFYYIFSDLGSGQLKYIFKKIKDKKIFILDHHISQKVKLNGDIMQINPILFGIDGEKEISSSGIAYLFSKALGINENSHLALVGAIGDRQDKNGFVGFNKWILDDAVSSNLVEVKKGVRFFGRQSRPINKLLEYSTDPYIPGVTGSVKGVELFLKEIGIKFKKGEKHRKIFDLSEDEMKVLIKGIIKKRKNEKKPKDIFGEIYELVNEPEDSIIKDLKEYSTLLNACGRMGKSSLGLGVCLGNNKSKLDAFDLLKSYKREIINALRWFEDNKSDSLILEDDFVIINSGSNIRSTIIGTIASIISYSADIKVKYIFAMAQNVDSSIKISARYSGNIKEGLDLSLLLNKVVSRIGGESGGHKIAAGAIIQQSKEDEFIDSLKKEIKEH